jgi:hypothetical protein
MGRGIRILNAEQYEAVTNVPTQNGNLQVYGV